LHLNDWWTLWNIESSLVQLLDIRFNHFLLRSINLAPEMIYDILSKNMAVEAQ